MHLSSRWIYPAAELSFANQLIALTSTWFTDSSRTLYIGKAYDPPAMHHRACAWSGWIRALNFSDYFKDLRSSTSVATISKLKCSAAAFPHVTLWHDMAHLNLNLVNSQSLYQDTAL